MKRIYALATTICALLSCQFALASNPFVPDASLQPDTSWAAVANYLATHAVAWDPGTEAALHFEAEFGLQTWAVVGSDASAIRPDGPAIGWPRVGMTIEFETEEEAVVAAQLILDVTYDIP